MATSLPSSPAPARRVDNLALVFQEVLTAIVRLRASRQRVGNAEVFRSQVRNALKTAEQEGLRRGYTLEDLRVATFAVVAFLDESILNSQNPAFADWPRQPLQEELFGVHVAGEIFFRNVERLLGRQDTPQLADLLEIHQLCLLLGFRGRFSATGMGEIRAILSQIGDKIHRIRGEVNERSAWQFVQQAPVRMIDLVGQRLRWTLIASAASALVLFVLYFALLRLTSGDLQSIASHMTL